MDEFTEPRACSACGLISATAKYTQVRTTNGALNLCSQCLDDINRKNPEVAMHRAKANGDYWAWQGDGSDCLETLVCPVLIHKDALARLLHERDGLIDGIKYANELLLDLWDRLGDGTLANKVKEVRNHLQGTITDERDGSVLQPSK